MDLSTEYMGLALRNPLVASPSPLSHTLDGIRRLAAMPDQRYRPSSQRAMLR